MGEQWGDLRNFCGDKYIGFGGGLDMEGEGEETVKNECCGWPLHLNRQSCHSLA